MHLKNSIGCQSNIGLCLNASVSVLKLSISKLLNSLVICLSPEMYLETLDQIDIL